MHVPKWQGGVSYQTNGLPSWWGGCTRFVSIAYTPFMTLTVFKKALYFDIRKGAHSIGSNVRDAASYVLWSLARAQSVDALRPHALELAKRLVAVSLFDREIHIRRAASAAFQEYVGRTVRQAPITFISC